MMKLSKFNLKVITFVAIAIFAFTGNSMLQAQDEPLSFEQTMIVVAAKAGDVEGVTENLGEMSTEELYELIGNICRNRSGEERIQILENVIRSAVSLQPVEGLGDFGRNIMSTVVANTAGDPDCSRVAMQALIGSAGGHPDLEDMPDEQQASTLGELAEQSASGAISAAEDAEMEASRIEGVAGGVATGGYDAMNEVPEGKNRIRDVADSMARGGVGAAAEPHKEGVALAMMRPVGDIPDEDMRRNAGAGILGGGGDAGGDDVRDALQQVQPPPPEEEAPAPKAPLVEEEVPEEPVDPVQPEDPSPK